jgi:serine phosphatase RsbU (regulator of sigma subunit)
MASIVRIIICFAALLTVSAKNVVAQSDGQNKLKFFIQKANEYYEKEQDDSARFYYNKALEISEKAKDTATMIRLFIASLEVLEAADARLNQLDKALKMSEQIKDTANLANCYRIFGVIMQDLGYDQTAEENYQKAAELSRLAHNHTIQAIVFCQLGYFYGGLAEKRHSDEINLKAIDCLRKSAHLFDSLGIVNAARDQAYLGLAGTLLGISEGTGDIRYADSCYHYFQKVENSSTILSSVKSDIYIRYLIQRKQYRKALDFISADSLLQKDPSDYHKKMHKIYSLMGDYRTAYGHLLQYIDFLTQNNVEENARFMAKVEADRAAEVERVQREADRQVFEADEKRMHTTIVALVFGLALVLLLVVFVVRMLHIKHKANAELAAKNTLLEEQKNEIVAQRDTIEAQRDEIQASINYARRIQRSLLTPAETISQIFPDHFLLYKPRNVVSGDYYWVGQFGDNKVCIVADCTGHGVPGGFMSVLGMTNLNYIVSQNVSPDAILNRLREAIIANLRQNDDAPTALHDDGEPDSAIDRSTDGMDAAVYVVNERQMTLTFAGANNPLVLIRGNEVQLLKANKMPVGIYARLNPFVSTTVELQHGDCIYTYSDGYQDQFGNGTDHKFMGKRLRELLLEIHQRPMAEQKEILNRTYEEWRGPASNQTDDVVVMGVRV